MKRLFKILLIVALVIGVIVVGVMLMTAGDRTIARQFMTDVSTGSFDAALAALHPEVAKEMPLERMQSVFADVEPYTDVSFSNVQASGGRTTLSGTASTETGCTSAVDFMILGDQIAMFNIEPLCRKP
ncbi:hypothetical protein Z946_3399 [Sulfitobacter noctilucicola]|uniref:DUF3887 domain-containing protein n=1 Tax=Sulfitobacter noctilucicola TaxID=1342301 RepID=A0A7W6M8D2_9RHOB|nr:hypothetical protein [Sulfitobacter noctilucicola]KIN64507.1 hypothetical protein Z946_3399 [Sulfitobacter noctilucicola]MBB4174334.1 hypothetical protein [Sulfitobacter noctilucicola]